ncbi:MULTISPECIES: porin [Mucilaginibacter]|uniref:Porin n=1 Tax=Mucilaginibacter rubeus TaxID=2027860 RepID=A0A5C1HTS8_9SPHI|nr:MULTISPECIES: porin [Mucilaginibacter]QEM09236.1 porin [Mucilaginibacter rubeus]
MKKVFLLFSFFSIAAFTVKAQDTVKTTSDAPLVIYGSVDTYYKYDFSDKGSQIPTSFASDHNSVSIGMIDLGLKKKVGKAAFVGELSFGPRGQAQSIPNGPSGDSFHIQNLYVSYDLTDKLNLTGGYMATFIGYEVISPVGNFNYSTSYLFTNGPFQNPGVKLTYAFSDKVSLMAGIFNDTWNNYTSTHKVNTFGSQLFVSPVKGWTAYLNLATGKESGTEVDLTTAYQITDAFKLGLNGATYSAPNDGGGFSGVALYPQLAVSKTVTLGLRGEYFKTKNGALQTFGPPPGQNVKAFTFTANIKSGPLTFIPEIRLDHGSSTSFINHSGDPSKSAGQFAVAAVYAF